MGVPAHEGQRQKGIGKKVNNTYQYRVAVIGAGSIGQRHIRNLRHLGLTKITALRSRQGHFQELDSALEVCEVSTWEELLDSQPDIAIVSNPSSLHLQTVFKLLPHVRGIFVEKPLSHSLEGIQELLAAIEQRQVVSFVGFSLEFNPVVKAMRSLLQSAEERTKVKGRKVNEDEAPFGKPLSLQATAGHWLPDWHPWEDYRQSYAARRDLGGGVTLTLIHEIQMALGLFGAAESVVANFPASKLLPLDVDVIADLMIRHKGDAISQIHLDYIQRPWHREGIISCENGWIRFDFTAMKVTAQSANDTEPQTILDNPAIDSNLAYIEMMGNFLECVQEKRIHHNFNVWHGIESLAVAECGFQSAERGCWIKLPEWIQRFNT